MARARDPASSADLTRGAVKTMASPPHPLAERGIPTAAVPGDGPTASRLTLVACWLAVLARIVLLLGLIALPIAFASYTVWAWVSEVVLGVFVVLMGAYIALAFTLRCPNCRRRFLVERREKHPAARHVGHLGPWGTVVHDVLRQREFTCMYCGALCRVS